MSGKDVLRILLVTYGFCRDIKIETYRGDYGAIGYEISARNDSDDEYFEMNVEGLLFNIYKIVRYMNDAHIEPRILIGDRGIKDVLSEDKLKELLSLSENRYYCKRNPFK